MAVWWGYCQPPYSFVHSDAFKSPTWLYIPRCLALGEWSHHQGYLGREDLFLYSSSVYSCHLFLISSVSVRSIPFLSFIMPIFAWNVPLVSLIFLKRSLVFPILFQSSSVTQSCPTFCDPMDCSTPGLPVHHQLPEFTQTHVHWVGDAIQPSHPLLSPSPLAFNLS